MDDLGLAVTEDNAAAVAEAFGSGSYDDRVTAYFNPDTYTDAARLYWGTDGVRDLLHLRDEYSRRADDAESRFVAIWGVVPTLDASEPTHVVVAKDIRANRNKALAFEKRAQTLECKIRKMLEIKR